MALRARIEISLDLLADAFGMPEGTKVLWGVSEPFNPVGAGVLMIGVDSDELPPVTEGKVAPLITPVLTLDYENGPREWIEWDWASPTPTADTGADGAVRTDDGV